MKLGIMKNVVLSLDSEGNAFLCFRKKIAHVNELKFREGIFVGPYIRELVKTQVLKLHFREWNI